MDVLGIAPHRGWTFNQEGFDRYLKNVKGYGPRKFSSYVRILNDNEVPRLKIEYLMGLKEREGEALGEKLSLIEEIVHFFLAILGVAPSPLQKRRIRVIRERNIHAIELQIDKLEKVRLKMAKDNAWYCMALREEKLLPKEKEACKKYFSQEGMTPDKFFRDLRPILRIEEWKFFRDPETEEFEVKRYTDRKLILLTKEHYPDWEISEKEIEKLDLNSEQVNSAMKFWKLQKQYHA